MQQAEKPSKPTSSIATKNNKYFSQSRSAHPVPTANNSFENMSQISYYQDNSNTRELSPKPDYKLHAHIKTTNYPDVMEDKFINRNKIIYKTLKLHERTESQFGELHKSKEKSANKNTSNIKKNNTFIKVQEGDTTDDNIDVNLIPQQYATSSNTKPNHHDETQEQLSELKKYFQDNSKTALNSTMTPPIKLRQMPRQNLRNVREYQSTRIQSSKSRQRQFNAKVGSKEMKYEIISKTLEQTIDENIQLKMENEQVKEMYKEALKTVSYLQQIIEDNYASNLKAKNTKYNKFQIKEIYSFLYPYENFNKIIKPPLQAELKMYRDKEEEFKVSMKKNIKDLQDELEKVKIRQEEYRSIYEFFKKENSNLHEELRQLRQQKVNKSILSGAQIQTQKKSHPNTASKLVHKQFEQQNETQKKKTSLFSSRVQGKSLKNQDIEEILANYQRQVVFPHLAAAEQRLHLMDQRCKELEKAIQNLLYQRREKKENQKKNARKMKSYGEVQNSNVSEGSQILQQSRIHSKSIKQKSGGKAIGRILKLIQQKPSSQPIPSSQQQPQSQPQSHPEPKQQPQLQPQVIPESPIIKELNEKVKQKQTRIEEQIRQITELEVKMALTQQQFKEKHREMDINQIKQLQAIEKQLKKIKLKLENCNMENFKYLYDQFTVILEQKKHVTISLNQLKYDYEQKHPKAWQLQKQLNETKRRKKQLVERCINLQNYIQKNINNGTNSDSFVLDGIYDKYFKEQSNQSCLKCLCLMNKHLKPYDESQGKSALNWILHVERAMEDSIRSINDMLQKLQERETFSI